MSRVSAPTVLRFQWLSLHDLDAPLRFCKETGTIWRPHSRSLRKPERCHKYCVFAGDSSTSRSSRVLIAGRTRPCCSQRVLGVEGQVGYGVTAGYLNVNPRLTGT
jgi:hypothetical protein